MTDPQGGRPYDETAHHQASDNQAYDNQAYGNQAYDSTAHHPAYDQTAYGQAYDATTYRQAYGENVHGYPGAPSPYPGPPRSSSTTQLLLGLVIVVLLAAGGVVIWLWQSGSGGSGTEVGTQAASSTTIVENGTTITTTSTVQLSPDDRIQQILAQDRPELQGNLNHWWTAQLSAKRPGVVADGKTWSTADILNEHEQLRTRFPQSRLLMSSEWPVFGEGGWWVTVNADRFSTPDAANSWCRSAGFDPEHCFAKLISTTGTPTGSTKYWK